MITIADGFGAFMEAALRGGKPDPELKVDEWAEENMIVTGEAPKPGPYRIAHTPLARRILQVLSPRDPACRIVVKGASQMLKTQVALCWMMACAHRKPKNILVLEPTDDLTKRLSSRIQKTIKAVEVLRGIFAQPRSRDSRNTVKVKEFEGGAIYIATAGSAANLAEIPTPYVYVDEASRLGASVDGEGDPIALADVRTTGFNGMSKVLITSSPGEAGNDKTDAQYERGTQEVYLVPCPHCDHHHELLLANFKHERDPESGWMARAWFVCPECGAEIDERHKSRMLRDAPLGGTAHWKARSLGDGETISFHVSAFYAPIGSITWLKLAREYAHAKELYDKGDPNAMQVFYNTRLALSWADTMDSTTAQELMQRADIVPRQVPDWALVVTIDVDTQVNRLEVQTHAWGPGLEHAVIDHQVLMGSPTQSPSDPQSVWARLDEIRRTPLVHASGVLIYASCYGIDTGGLNTQDVYNYASARVNHGCVAHHGANRPNKPIVSAVPTKADIDWNGKRVEGGVLLWQIGTDTAKDHLHNRYKLLSGWGAMRFSTALSLDWFEQLLAESRRLRRKPGGGYRVVWDKNEPSARNEALDLAVGNLALAHHLNLHKWTLHDWERLRTKLIPKQVTPDLFAPAPAPQIADLPPDGKVEEAAASPPPVPAPVHTYTPPAAPSGRRILHRGIR